MLDGVQEAPHRQVAVCATNKTKLNTMIAGTRSLNYKYIGNLFILTNNRQETIKTVKKKGEVQHLPDSRL